MKFYLSMVLFIILLFLLMLWMRNNSYLHQIDNVWSALITPTESPLVYDEELSAELPPSVHRYFQHTLPSGEHLPGTVEIQMTGEIKLSPSSDWIPFQAQQIIRGREGFVWKAQAKVNPILTLSSADYYHQRKARLYFSLFKMIPVVNVSSEAVVQSARGRLLIESLWIPSVLLPGPGISWSAIDSSTIQAKITLEGDTSTLSLVLGDSGNLREISMLRYQTVGKDSTALVPFGAYIEEEKKFGKFTIPSKLRVGWNFGTSRYDEFFRAEIHQIRFF